MLTIVVTNKYKHFTRKFNAQVDPDKNLYACVVAGVRVIKKRKYHCIYLIFHPDSLDDRPVVTHECVHAKNILYKYRGVSNDRDNDEPEAYLMETLVGKVSRYLSKVKRKLK